MDGGNRGIDIGGPEVLTYREVAEVAFQSLGKQVRISSVPVWIMKIMISLTGIFNRHQAQLLAFFTTAMTSEGIAPLSGTHTLRSYFTAQGLPGQEKGV